MASINIRGVSELLAKIRKAESMVWPTVIATVEEYVDKMIAEARKNVPVDRGVARDSIGKDVRTDAVVFFVDSAHGAIQEFGHGGLMSVPAEMEEEAMKFKGYKGGDFEEFVRELEEWCVRKGIDPNAAYPIALKILREGLRPQPFFYPAYRKFKDEMLVEIDKRLQKLFDF